MEKFNLDQDTVFGANASLEVFDLLRDRNVRKFAFIIDENIALLPAVKKIQERASQNEFQTVTSYLARGHEEPDYDYLDEVVAAFRGFQFDALIGIGGGSACDLAKGVGILLTNPGRGIEYRGFNKVQRPGIPVILMPTTAGTGTEVTATASFNDLHEKRKLGINGCNVRAFLGVLDPVLTATCPPQVTVSAGLDAIVHALEAVTAKSANLFSKAIGGNAFQILFRNLPKVVSEPKNLEWRMNMLAGSHLAGMAMANVGGGPASGISYPLGVHFKVPHGIAGGIFLPHVLELNVRKQYTGYATLNDLIDPASATLSEEARAEAFVRNFQCFYNAIGAPANLSSFRVRRENVPLLLERTLLERQANLEANPVPCLRDDVALLLERVTV